MRKLLQNKITISVVNFLLIGALAISLLAPAADHVNAQPINPISEEDILPIDAVDLGVVADGALGQSIQNAGSDQSEGETGEEGSDPGEEPQPEQEGQQEAEKDPEEQTDENYQEAPKPVPQPEEPDRPQENGEGEMEETDEGEEGGEELEADLALVLTWYKYGTEPKTVVCEPNSGVGRTIQDTQLEDDRLRYDLSFAGFDADDAEITDVRFGLLYTAGRSVAERGYVDLALPEGETERAYGFYVTALWGTKNADGEDVEEELEFQIAIYYESGLDLEMELTWTDKTADTDTIRCAADKSAAFSVKSSWLQMGQFPYSLAMTGKSAEDAQLVSVTWRNTKSEQGTLEQTGKLSMSAPGGSETYTITATAEVENKTVLFTWFVTYESTIDLELEFTWYENGTVAHAVAVEANEQSSLSLRRNQLSGDQLQYGLSLKGDSAAQASILSAAIEGEGERSNLHTSGGSTFLTMPESGSARYTIYVTARVGGSDAETVQFAVAINYTSDVTLKLSYTAKVDGTSQTFTVSCENRREKQAETLYDDQLENDVLPYTLSLAGDDAENITITSVTCYQSGSGRSIDLSHPSGTVTMLLTGGSVGENSFTVKAQDASGNSYEFRINIPYKHRGSDTVKIVTDLQPGQVVANESEVIISVEAWSEDAEGNVVERILANGTATKLQVTLDGETYTYTGVSGNRQQYTLIPQNPETGDRNTHILHIYAEASNGDYGELTVEFEGERSMEGQVIGQASIYVDMSVLGLGIRGPVSYEILKDEPVSYAIAKAVWSYEDDRFGASEDTFGWPSSYAGYNGSLDMGFYLRKLGDGSDLGSRASALSISRWSDLGTTDEEILAAIDARFGAGSNLATLWRCIYRNGVDPSTVSDSYSIGEFDFTMGSGWMYAIGGSTYYPGTAMSEYYLRDGDVLTLRYTLAYGWDVGAGQTGYGNSVGYCVTCLNGSFSIHHNMDETNTCRSCGITEACSHTNVEWKAEGDLCGQYCNDCGQFTQQPGAHQWKAPEYRPEDTEYHYLICDHCGMEQQEVHDWTETSNTATCEEAGTAVYFCEGCNGERTEEIDALGHNPQGVWQASVEMPGYHLQNCARCGAEVADSRGQHTYVYVGDDWQCATCQCWHDWECGNDQCSEIQNLGDRIVYRCDLCGLTMEQPVEGGSEPDFEPDPEPEPEPDPDPEPEPEPDPDPDPDPEPEPEPDPEPEEWFDETEETEMTP